MTKNRFDIVMAALGLLTALLMLSGCATDSAANPTLTALTSVRHIRHEPITRVAFNSMEPDAARLGTIETAAGQ